MAAKKKTRKRKKPPSRIRVLYDGTVEFIAIMAERLHPREPGVRFGIHALAWMILVGGLTAAWVVYVPQLSARAELMAWAEEVEVEFETLPEWMPGDLLAQLELNTVEALSGDPWRQEDLTAARDNLLATGWFANVRQIRRVRSDLVRIDATFLEPFALIRSDGVDHLVDVNGRLLPRSFDAGTSSGLIVITGIEAPRPANFGNEWPGADVTAAIRLTRVLERRDWTNQIRSVDASEFPIDRSLAFTTDIGARFEWGSPPGAEKPLEPLSQRKLAFLEKAFQDSAVQRIDSGYAGRFRFLDEALIAE